MLANMVSCVRVRRFVLLLVLLDGWLVWGAVGDPAGGRGVVRVLDLQVRGMGFCGRCVCTETSHLVIVGTPVPRLIDVLRRNNRSWIRDNHPFGLGHPWSWPASLYGCELYGLHPWLRRCFCDGFGECNLLLLWS